jgi:hypothetical protein
VRIDQYGWYIQLVLSMIFAAHAARIAQRKGRHPFAAALLMLISANAWPVIWQAVGGVVADRFHLHDPARTTLVTAIGLGGLMFGVATSYAIVGCWRPILGRPKT